MYEASGKIKLIYDTQTFASGFSKREFVVTTSADKFPQDLKFEVVKDKCSLLDSFDADQEVVVNFDIRGNEYNGRYYVNLSCWKIQAAGASGNSSGNAAPSRSRAAAPTAATSSAEPSLSDLRNEDDFDDDDIPF
ncbi:MAG: DUF3127 domain-containing protein [Luteolibacter sp.]